MFRGFMFIVLLLALVAGTAGCGNVDFTNPSTVTHYEATIDVAAKVATGMVLDKFKPTATELASFSSIITTVNASLDGPQASVEQVQLLADKIIASKLNNPTARLVAQQVVDASLNLASTYISNNKSVQAMTSSDKWKVYVLFTKAALNGAQQAILAKQQATSAPALVMVYYHEMAGC